MTDEWSQMAANAIAHSAQMVQVSMQEAAWAHGVPSAVFKPRLFIDGNQWCALYGENIQDGVAGFGDSPADACAAFDAAWFKKLPTRKEGSS